MESVSLFAQSSTIEGYIPITAPTRIQDQLGNSKLPALSHQRVLL